MHNKPLKNGTQIVNALLLIANSIFALLFLLVTVEAIVNTRNRIPASWIMYLFLCFLWCVLLLGVLIGYAKLPQCLRGKCYKRVAVLVLIVTQFFYIWCVYSQPDSDAYVVNYIAYHYVQGDLSTQPFFWTEYLSFYTNNMPITQLLILLYRLYLPDTLEASWLLLSLAAALLSDLAIFFTVKVTKVLLGERFAVAALVLSIPMLAMSESGSIFYTDVVALWTIPAALYILLRARKSEHMKFWVSCCAAGGIFAFGIWMKPQVVVALISIGIVWTLEIFRTKRTPVRYRRIQGLVGLETMFAGCLFVLQLSTQAALDRIPGHDLVEKNQFPMLHFIAMGLNEEAFGTYNEQDVNETKAQIGLSAKKIFLTEKIENRLHSMGLKRFVVHLNKKLTFGTGNGTFTSGRTWRGIPLNTSSVAHAVQEWCIVDNEKWNEFSAVWIQTGYLLILVCVTHSVVYVLIKKKREQIEVVDRAMNVIRISLIGIILFLLLLESNLRYLYALMPLMIILCVYDIKCSFFQRNPRLKQNETVAQQNM